MGQPSIKEIEAQLADWDFLTQLPQQVGSFRLEAGTGIKGQILNIAAYVDQEHHRRLDLTYTGETFDYVPVKTIGLHSFRDERYFSRDREYFAKLVLEGLERMLADIDSEQPQKMPFEAKALGFENWDYWRQLPKRIDEYELYITPDKPVAYINGSYIFLDYSDFTNGNQLFFFYNVFRNEIFAEKKVGYLPLTTSDFDVKDLQLPKKGAKKLPVAPAYKKKDQDKLAYLAQLLEENLVRTLESISKG